MREFEQFEGLSLFKFVDKFKTDDDCKAYLFHLKFSKGFTCSKCNGRQPYKGIKPFTLVCKGCRHVESSTSNTLFHKVKFSLRKAFAIVYEMTTTAKGMSANQASKKYEIQYNTAWLFMKKVRVSMKSSEIYPLQDKVYVDEFVIGGYEKGAVGRKNDSKKIKGIMAVEVTPQNRIKRLYSMEIESYCSGDLLEIFDKHISKASTIHTDEWKGYIPLKQVYKIVQDKKTRNNSPVNRMIQQLKSWIRGTHHSIKKYHVSTYFDEFSFRINRSQWKDSIFHKCVERMVRHEKLNRLQLSQVECPSRESFEERIRLYETMGVRYDVRYGKVKLVA